MSIVSRAFVAAFACLLLATPASAGITDRELSCTQYLKKGVPKGAGRPDPSIAAKVRAFCAANPRMTAMDAEIAVSGD